MHVPWVRYLLVAAVVACADPAGDRGEARGPTAALEGQANAAASIQGTTRSGDLAGTSVISPVGTTGSRPVPPAASGTGADVPPPDPSSGNVRAASKHALPCDVVAILKEKCQTCHGDPLMSGPMPLTTWSDLQAVSTTVPGTTIAARVQARIDDSDKPMPPITRPALTTAEKRVLTAYLDAGAPRSAEACTTASAEPGGTMGGAGEGYRPPDNECDYIQELRGHGGQTVTDATPFTVPNGGDHYEMFYFRPKWTEKVQVINIDAIIDNGQILHHWLLYMEDGVGGGDGTHESDLGLQSPSSVLLSGWAPGNGALPLAREVGLQAISGANSRFALEIHYNTGSNPANRNDRSGARLCVTKKLRPKEAAIHWLGTQAIIGLGAPSEASGTCTVQTESHIVAHSPHMHMMGRHMKTIVIKRGGKKVTITDQPFAFDDQRVFPIDNANGEIVVSPGDVIETTCSYAAGVFTFGPDTDQEMCYNFILAWPAGSLSNGLPGLVGGQNTCIDAFI